MSEANSHNEKEMTFFDHLEELRWHLIRSSIAVGVSAIAIFLAKGLIFDQIIFGPTKANFPTYQFGCELKEKMGFGICIDNIPFQIVNLELAGQFLIHLKMALILGIIISIPYVFWEIWRFIKPGLYNTEVRASKVVIFFASMLFFIGVLFGYYVLMPFSVNFFGTYSVSAEVSNTFSLTNYVGFISMFVLASGILFELPMAVYFLSKMGLVTPDLMRTYRKHAFVAILLLAAIITPADVGTQILVTIPVYGLYEISVFISAWVVRKQKEKETSEELTSTNNE